MKRFALLCSALLFVCSIQACRNETEAPEAVTVSAFGKLPDGRDVTRYTLLNGSGMTVRIIDYGATVTELHVPDRDGKIGDVVLGYDTVEGYADGTAYLGAIVGRYGNRIAGGRFTLDGQPVQVTVNDGENHLHGGRTGFNKVLWEGKIREDSPDPSVELLYTSPDGEEGYPGTVHLTVIYTLTEKNELRIDYVGSTDKPTVLNPTQHSYFNLTGDFTQTILGHELMIKADSITPVGPGLIPTGKYMSVDGTPFDFRTLTKIGSRIDEPDEQLKLGRGYDHNWVLQGNPGEVREAAELYDPESGRLMTVRTDQPGLQFYSGNFLDGTIVGKNGIAYGHRTGLCLETQAFPDTPNEPQFPQVTLRPGQMYHQTTIYQFSTR